MYPLPFVIFSCDVYFADWFGKLSLSPAWLLSSPLLSELTNPLHVGDIGSPGLDQVANISRVQYVSRDLDGNLLLSTNNSTVVDDVSFATGGADTRVNFSDVRVKLGFSFSQVLCGRLGGVVYGTNPFREDSVLETAVVHAGIVPVRSCRAVRVTVRAAQPFSSSFSNGVLSREAALNTTMASLELAADVSLSVLNISSGIAMIPVQANASAGYLVVGDGTIFHELSDVGLAASHAGVILNNTIRSVCVNVSRMSGPLMFPSSTRHGVSSTAFIANGSFAIFSFCSLETSFQAAFYRQVGRVLDFVVNASAAAGQVIGTDVYDLSSSISAAALHAGVLTAGAVGRVRIVVVEGRSSYTATSRNGVDSSASGPSGTAYKFVSIDSSLPSAYAVGLFGTDPSAPVNNVFTASSQVLASVFSSGTRLIAPGILTKVNSRYWLYDFETTKLPPLESTSLSIEISRIQLSGLQLNRTAAAAALLHALQRVSTNGTIYPNASVSDVSSLRLTIELLLNLGFGTYADFEFTIASTIWLRNASIQNSSYLSWPEQIGLNRTSLDSSLLASMAYAGSSSNAGGPETFVCAGCVSFPLMLQGITLPFRVSLANISISEGRHQFEVVLRLAGPRSAQVCGFLNLSGAAFEATRSISHNNTVFGLWTAVRITANLATGNYSFGLTWVGGCSAEVLQWRHREYRPCRLFY